MIIRAIGQGDTNQQAQQVTHSLSLVHWDPDFFFSLKTPFPSCFVKEKQKPCVIERPTQKLKTLGLEMELKIDFIHIVRLCHFC